MSDGLIEVKLWRWAADEPWHVAIPGGDLPGLAETRTAYLPADGIVVVGLSADEIEGLLTQQATHADARYRAEAKLETALKQERADGS